MFAVVRTTTPLKPLTDVTDVPMASGPVQLPSVLGGSAASTYSLFGGDDAVCRAKLPTTADERASIAVSSVTIHVFVPALAGMTALFSVPPASTIGTLPTALPAVLLAAVPASVTFARTCVW